MSKLKPCPFCGGKAYLRTVMSINFAECEVCYADGPREASKEKAADSWNRRAEPENEALTCEGCEELMETPNPCFCCKRHWPDRYRRKPEGSST